MSLDKLLSGGDLRSVGASNAAVVKIRDQRDFDGLFTCLFYDDRIVVMRAADAIEKITKQHPGYLTKYKEILLSLCSTAKNKELKWHLALLLPRLNLNEKETSTALKILMTWLSDRKESRIVRVNSLQSIYEMVCTKKKLVKRLNEIDALNGNYSLLHLY